MKFLPLIFNLNNGEIKYYFFQPDCATDHTASNYMTALRNIMVGLIIICPLLSALSPDLAPWDCFSSLLDSLSGPRSSRCWGFEITLRHTTRSRILPDEWLSQHSQEADNNAFGGVRTCNCGKRADSDLRLRPRGHRDRPHDITSAFKNIAYAYGANLVLETWSVLAVHRQKILQNIDNFFFTKYRAYLIVRRRHFKHLT